MQEVQDLFHITGWELHEVGEPPRIRTWTLDPEDLGSDEVLVEVAGCGVCHTDLGFHYDGVRTKHPLPLILGHEISGIVVSSGPSSSSWVGQRVIIPAVMPCGECDDCTGGRSNVCSDQLMPGNDIDGGFASHIRTPSRWLVPIPETFEGDIAHLSVIADAVSTPWQAILRSEVEDDDVVIVVGCGGVGGYCAQLARSRGAHVICLDVSPEKLDSMARLGFEHLREVSGETSRECRAWLRELTSSEGWASKGWKIFECSGNPSGQTLAFELIGPSGTLAVVGFTMSKVSIRLSNLMAHDARAFGNWGCQPEYYPELLERVLSGAVNLLATTERRRLSEISEVFESTHHGETAKRTILIPDELWEG
ncbi:MAG: 6-hydroxycyclohex-1-ene-1-carbonyl-CoA dehydrogenase [Candidatus Thalassarchaeaceae archaeon]|jgi:6-hydroxycyclohex-1-ene-1-carbonyl-CoA dehydrogenase|nr:6-hydroxycyclohex-1-ene-1-carbonyl-CoA dehydrogenase [Euryarchaeota archaeon]MDP6220412.1 6-hydroxycyclohex-1-ene-1-carbonyl-CoA dehydrogenase [Candidatus Thalassarchaeaceae archaeon]MBV43432.1 6-hydroxycyclohex-1-ene-1-carbonyl-CoA dehydrogenase [Euryarchaeota archaeon]MDP7091916.1 6-hydroxycyclohex-1-ene-1-carbonyl-CoA dehydrogenase [Candidatus Thalassarchaeaceae archaeon]MDP7256836.1 6-hydroxycyclohex-1-ene-1-carbonyl-CoA dehydrogenase [Candidatus Thalassarchaeaceae archaeon]|tara:strand:- start:51880 stop:52974 length:1095 start_codon:yes stop_codon:yes gene_type:complete